MRRPVPPPRSLPVRQHIHKGDAEIPTAIELVFLEIEAAFKTRQDREECQTCHSRIVAEMRQELVKERRLDVTAAHDLGYATSSVRVESVKTEDTEQDVKQKEQDGLDAGLHVFLHTPNLEDLDAVFSSELPATNAVNDNPLFEHGASAVRASSAFQKSVFEPELTSTGAANAIDVMSFSSFEELLNHFPYASLT
ncbi:hypothetical protein HDU80_011752 [Chytriomyces hyalinus]|nr:hypothetical protein HDU80_011752 [Chytriomyces hyalinus]